MAFEAGSEVRDSGKGLGFEETVTCIAPQPLFRMLFMVERDGLLNLESKAEADDKEKRYYPNGESNEEGFQFLNPFCFSVGFLLIYDLPHPKFL